MIAGIGFRSTVTITSFNELFESYIKRYSAFTVATSKEKATNAVFLKFVNTNHLKLIQIEEDTIYNIICLLYTSPSPRDMRRSRMPSSA